MNNQNFKSQAGQDKWVCKFFNYKRDGYFIELGGYDGVTFSNTYFLEKELNWQGIIVEASQSLFPLVENSRDCICVNKAIYKENTTVKFHTSKWDGNINENGKETIEAITPKTLLEQNNSPKIIDYISLDIEGGELDVLNSFPFNEYEVILWTIEHNIKDIGPEYKNKLFSVMNANGFVRIREDVPCGPNGQPFEDWYVHPKYMK